MDYKNSMPTTQNKKEVQMSRQEFKNIWSFLFRPNTSTSLQFFNDIDAVIAHEVELKIKELQLELITKKLEIKGGNNG